MFLHGILFRIPRQTSRKLRHVRYFCCERPTDPMTTRNHNKYGASQRWLLTYRPRKIYSKSPKMVDSASQDSKSQRHELLLQEIEGIDEYWGPTFRWEPVEEKPSQPPPPFARSKEGLKSILCLTPPPLIPLQLTTPHFPLLPTPKSATHCPYVSWSSCFSERRPA